MTMQVRWRGWTRGAAVLLLTLLGACAAQREARVSAGNDFGVLVMAHGGEPSGHGDAARGTGRAAHCGGTFVRER